MKWNTKLSHQFSVVVHHKQSCKITPQGTDFNLSAESQTKSPEEYGHEYKQLIGPQSTTIRPNELVFGKQTK